MANPVFLQTKTVASDASAGTSHVITLDSAVATVGGTTSPSVLILQASYDGNTGSLISGITDSQSNTWARCTDGTTALTFSNGAGVNGEMWYAMALVGGTAPTITVTTSSSVKVKLAVGEMNGVRPVSSIDRTLGRIHAPASAATTRTSADFTGGSAYTTRRRGMIEVIVTGVAWNDARTTVANATNFTSTFYLHGTSSNLGVGMARSSVERTNIVAQYSNGRFTVASGTEPSAVMSCTFYRDGVVTSTDEDGIIQNIEGTQIIETNSGLVAPSLGALNSFWGGNGIYRSSTSAPFGGTGGSEIDNAYAFFPDYSANLLSGVTIGATALWNLISSGGYDDGWFYIFFYGKLWKDGTLGTTLTTGDEGVDTVTGNVFANVDIATAGLKTYSFNVATYFNTSGYTTAAIKAEGDTMGGSSGSWAAVNDYANSAPMYIQLTLIYPSASTRVPQLTLTDVGT